MTRYMSPVSLIFHIKSTVNSVLNYYSQNFARSRDRMSMLASPILNHNASASAYHFIFSYPPPICCQSRKQVLDRNRNALFLPFNNNNNFPFISSSLNWLMHASTSIPSPFVTHTQIQPQGQPFKQLVSQDSFLIPDRPNIEDLKL